MQASQRVVMMTGATGHIGIAVARIVLQAGGKLAATVRRPWQVDKLREELGEQRLLVGVVPPRDAEAAAGFVKGANDALGPITDFVGAAGCLRQRQPGREPAGDFDELLEANVLANTTVTRALLPHLRRRGRGSLLFVGMPTDASALSATCRASKAALQAFVDGLRQDLADTDLLVDVVAPPLARDASIEHVVAVLAGTPPAI